MADIMQGLVAEAKKNKFSTLGPGVSDEDVGSVWDNVSNFVEKQMALQKGVNVQGLGTFTFSQKKLDVGNNKYILIQRPVFILSEKFAQTHGLNYTKHHVAGQIPVVQLNYAALSFDSPFDRDTVEACVKEVLSALHRSIEGKKNVEFVFKGIGRLQIRDSKVKMKFYTEFINSMDGSGKLVESMRDRPDTCDSVMTERAPSRPHTSNTLVLPRISQTGLNLGPADSDPLTSRPAMPPIEEEAVVDGAEILKTYEDQPIDDFEPINVIGDTNNEDNPSFTNAPPDRSASRAVAPVAKATGISFHDDLLPTKSQSPRGVRGVAALPSPTPMIMKRSLSPLNTPPTPRTGAFDDFPRSKSSDGALRKPLPLTGTKVPSPPATGRPHTTDSCGHTNAGQELCYLCHQRARRNIPVSFTEERRRREEEEDKLLQQYQHMKDSEAILQQQEQLLGKRHENQKMAAFNLGVAEAIQSKQQARDVNFHPSYIFQRRPLTPPKFIKQDLYSNDLADQVDAREHVEKKRRADEEFMERLEQVQLAEDLAAQRGQYLKDKADQQENYKRALSAQIRVRDNTRSPTERPRIRVNKRLGPLTLPSPQIILPFSQAYTMKISEGDGPNRRVLRFKPKEMPARVPDSSEPVFGKNDMNNDKMMERRRAAHELYQEQLGIVEQRKREAILKRLTDQKEEENMLRQTKEEMVADRADRYHRLTNNRKKLENDWFMAFDVKKKRDQEERLHQRSAGLLVHEQCDKYKRCNQCERRLPNCGESNIWRESRYIPGSRLMV